MAEYFRLITEYFDIKVNYRGTPIFTDLGIHVDPNGMVYWIKNYEQQHHTTTGKSIANFTQQDVDQVIATLIEYVIKMKVDSGEAHNSNKKLAEKIFREIEAKQK